MELFTVETCGADKSLNALRADRSGATEAFREDGADTGRCAETAHREADRQETELRGRTSLHQPHRGFVEKFEQLLSP